MALINKLFPRPFSSSQALNTKSDSCLLPSKKQVVRQRSSVTQTLKKPRNAQNSCTRDETNCVPNQHAGAAQIRLLLFRECEVRGRRLIFDSGGGCCCGDGAGHKSDADEFRDDQLIKDMVFGSATLKYSGENYRFHDFGATPWKGYDMMLAKVFLVPPIPVQPSKLDPRTAKVANLTVDKLTAKDSGYVEWTEASGTSLAQVGSGISSARTSFGSMTLAAVAPAKPERNAVSDSLLMANGNHKASLNGHERHRKVRLAVALLFLPEDPSKDISVRDLVHERFTLVEHFVQRLQYGLIRAYWSRHHFQVLVREAIAHFERDLNGVLHFAKDSPPPAYVSLHRRSRACADQQQVADQFMSDWDSVTSETETKLTRFFWSSLLSAVLTYHVNWLHSYVTEPVEFHDCGTRVLVVSKDPTLAERLLHVLSLFVRSSVLLEASQTNGSAGKMRPSPVALAKDRGSPSGCDALSLSAERLRTRDDDRQSPAAVQRLERNGSSGERRASCGRRGSQQVENTRYLRNYYDVRFQLSPDTISKRDARPFANLMSSIAKNGFQDFYTDEVADSGASEAKTGCAFFVGSAPDYQDSPPGRQQHRSSPFADCKAESEPIQIQIPSVKATGAEAAAGVKHPHLLRWSYGTGLDANYQAGRTLQSCDPSRCDWLRELQLDLRAACARAESGVACVVANTDTWDVQVLTSTKDDSYPPMIKQNWLPVTMSGQVADLVESTQLLWSMLRNSEQCLDHVDSRLRFLCKKSEDLGAMLSASIQSWNVDRVTRLLGIEPPDLPLLMAACSVHSPVVSSMGGVTML